LPDSVATARVRSASEKIDGAAESLNILRGKIKESKTAKAVHLSREVAELAREAIARYELLIEGLTATLQEIETLRERTFHWHDKVVHWIYLGATANTLAWLWIGVGQLGLLGWGRRRLLAAPR
jgi:hypothetical protein